MFLAHHHSSQVTWGSWKSFFRHVGTAIQASWPASSFPPLGGNSGHPRSHSLPDVHEQPGNQQADVYLERLPQGGGGECGVGATCQLSTSGKKWLVQGVSTRGNDIACLLTENPQQ